MASSTPQISPAAQRAFTKATAYDAHRPSYATHLPFLLEQTRVAGVEGAHLLDLGAGTGKFTEALASRPEKFRITAVEPHAEMRDVLAKKALPGVTVVEGSAEDLKALEEESVDAVFAAQVCACFFSFLICPLELSLISFLCMLGLKMVLSGRDMFLGNGTAPLTRFQSCSSLPRS
jgi:SAM-dependent methyltransferase